MMVYWVLAVFFTLLSYLVFFNAPAMPLWFVAIPTIELSIWFSIATAVLGFTWPGGSKQLFGRVLCAALTVAFLTPTFLAWRLGHRLPTELQKAFNISTPLTGPAFSLKRYLQRTDIPPVGVSTERFKSDGQEMEVDLYRAPNTDLLPVIVFVHSGSWRNGERGELPDWNRLMASWGFVVAAADYRFAPKFHFPAQRNDVLATIDYLTQNAARLKIDASKIILMGRSAGAQIAMITAVTAHNPRVKGAVSLYGPLDMEYAYSRPGNPLIMNSRQVLRDYMGGVPTDFPEGYRQASAVHQADKITPPMLIIHGLNDALVSPVHAFHMNERLAELGVPHYFLNLRWATHASEAILNGPSGQLMIYAVRQFLLSAIA